MKADSTANNDITNRHVESVLSLINITYTPSYETKSYDEKFIDFACKPGASIDISGYDYFISDFNVNNFDSKDSSCSTYQTGAGKAKICFDMKKNYLSLSGLPDSTFNFDLMKLIRAVKEKKYVNYNLINPHDLTLVSGQDNSEVKIIFRSIRGEYTDKAVKISRLHADIFIKLNKEKINVP
jgi:hypothetical protein